MFIYKSKILLLITLFLSSVNIAYCADIYKWTDKDGVVHFGDNPNNSPASVYKVPKNNSTNISTTNSERIARQKKLVDSMQAERLSQKEKRLKKRKDAKARKYNCQISKDKLERYKSASGIYIRNDVGEKIFLNKKKKQEEIQLMKEQTEKWCN